MSEWDDYAAGWDDDAGARAYATEAFASLERVVEASGLNIEGMNVLDFGCGTGLLTEQLVAKGASVLTVDTSQAMLDVLQAKILARGWTTVRTSTELPATPDSYQLIVCSSVCAFLDDYPGTATALVALLAPGGLFVQWDWERRGDDEHGLSSGEITNALSGAGLEQVSVGVGFEVGFEDATMRPLMGHGRRP